MGNTLTKNCCNRIRGGYGEKEQKDFILRFSSPEQKEAFYAMLEEDNSPINETVRMGAQIRRTNLTPPSSKPKNSHEDD